MKNLYLAIGTVLSLLLFRYLLSVFVFYLMPINQWNSAINGFEFTLAPFEDGRPTETNLFGMWAKWDTPFYVTIATEGYNFKSPTTEFSNLAFYPLFPVLIKAFLMLFNDFTYAFALRVGLLVSNVFFVLSTIMLLKLGELLKFNTFQRIFLVGGLIAFPSSYFLNLIYTESLFLFLTLSVFYCMFTKRYALAALLLGLSLITRVTGFALILPFFLYSVPRLLQNPKPFVIKLLELFSWPLMVFLPVFLFYLYLYSHSGDFFLAFTVQKAWGNGYALPFSLFMSYFSVYGTNIGFAHILQVVFFLVFLMFMLYQLYLSNKRVLTASGESRVALEKLLYLNLYGVLYLLLISSVPNMSSVIRYLLMCFPLYFTLAQFLMDTEKSHFSYKRIGILLITYGVFVSFQTFFYVLFLMNVAAYGF